MAAYGAKTVEMAFKASETARAPFRMYSVTTGMMGVMDCGTRMKWLVTYGDDGGGRNGGGRFATGAGGSCSMCGFGGKRSS